MLPGDWRDLRQVRHPLYIPEAFFVTNGVSLLQTVKYVELYKLTDDIFGLAVVIRLFHAGSVTSFP